MFRWEFALLEIAWKLGGSSSLQEMYAELDDSDGPYLLDDADLRQTIYSNRPAFQHQVRSHVSNLCQKGHLARIDRGHYRLTRAGGARYVTELATYDTAFADAAQKSGVMQRLRD